MRKFRFIPFLLAIIILTLSVFITAKISQNTGGESSRDESAQTEDEEEMRGVWVSYITLDVENENAPEDAFKNKINTIIEDMKSGNFNTIVVQVRPFSDALYKSGVYPWSHILTGSQGEDPGFDPLEYICDVCHKNEIKVHAWVNPYRVKTKETPKTLSEDNPYSKDPSIGFEIDGAVYLNPASEKARELIAEGVREIVKFYDVDGIQFDDYFYPETDKNYDSDAYEAYKKGVSSPLSLENWRKENVNSLIESVYQVIKNEKKNVVFGISPQGNLANNSALSADVLKWCSVSGFIDYICPQIYFSLDNPALTFEDSLGDWLKIKKHKNLKLYVGLAGYKAGTDADEGTWMDNTDILKTEIEILREKNTDGFMLYSYESFHNAENAVEIENIMSYLVSSPTQ